MTRYLLDSDAVIDFLNGVATTADLIDTLYQQQDTLCTCDVVIAEVHAGLLPADRERGRRLLGSLWFLACAPTAAELAGVWRYDFRRRGLQLATTDCLISAIAHEHRATLITGNVAHFPMTEVSLLALPR